jgi:hypothetical protein
VKSPFAWFESVGGAPPISAKVITVSIHTVCSVTGKIGAAGAVICYFGSHLAMMARAFYSHSPFFRGWGWQFIVECASVLENHLRAYVCYFYGLCVFPLIRSLFLRLLGIHEPEANKEMGDLNAAKRPHQFVRRLIACLLLIPFVQVFLGALAGIMTLVLVLVLFSVHALVGCRRYGGILYFWMRVAGRIGIRNMVRRRYR